MEVIHVQLCISEVPLLQGHHRGNDRGIQRVPRRRGLGPCEPIIGCLVQFDGVTLTDHRTHIFEIQVTLRDFKKLILQKTDLSKLLSLKNLRGFMFRR